MDSPVTPKTWLQKICERAAASRFFTVSLLIHLVIILIGGSVVLVHKYTPPPDDFIPTGPVVNTEKNKEPPPEEVKPKLDLPKMPPKHDPLAQNFPPSPASSAPAPTTGFGAPGQTMLPRILTTIKRDTASPFAHSSPTDGRMTGSNRETLIKKGDGDPASENAVVRGLRWLKAKQNTDGSWSTQHQAAMTGFGLLSFLGHGELPMSPTFGDTVGKALNWVLENGEKNQGRLSMESRISQQGAYAHGIVTYALGEYCLLTGGRDERAVKLFQQAVKIIVDGQGADGGWMYHFNKEQSDTSVTGWQMQALKVAQLTGLPIDGADAALEKAIGNLKRVQGPNGGFGYRTAEDKYSLTGIGVLCGTYARDAKDMEARLDNGLKFMMSQLESNPVEYRHPKADLYAWYYNTQACMMMGAASHDARRRKAWTDWNGRFAAQLVKSQAADGSWPPMAAGSHDNLQKDEQGAGPYYRTTLCLLMLEVYYRYTPTMR